MKHGADGVCYERVTVKNNWGRIITMVGKIPMDPKLDKELALLWPGGTETLHDIQWVPHTENVWEHGHPRPVEVHSSIPQVDLLMYGQCLWVQLSELTHVKASLFREKYDSKLAA